MTYFLSFVDQMLKRYQELKNIEKYGNLSTDEKLELNEISQILDRSSKAIIELKLTGDKNE